MIRNNGENGKGKLNARASQRRQFNQNICLRSHAEQLLWNSKISRGRWEVDEVNILSNFHRLDKTWNSLMKSLYGVRLDVCVGAEKGRSENQRFGHKLISIFIWWWWDFNQSALGIWQGFEWRKKIGEKKIWKIIHLMRLYWIHLFLSSVLFVPQILEINS